MPRNPDSNRAPGRPIDHGLRKLADDYKRRELLNGPMVDAYRERFLEITDDHGGIANMTGSQVTLAESAALASLITRCMADEVFRRGSVFGEDGELLPFLGKNYIGWANTLRQNLMALGLKPDRAEQAPSLDQYLNAQGGAEGDAGNESKDD